LNDIHRPHRFERPWTEGPGRLLRAAMTCALLVSNLAWPATSAFAQAESAPGASTEGGGAGEDLDAAFDTLDQESAASGGGDASLDEAGDPFDDAIEPQSEGGERVEGRASDAEPAPRDKGDKDIEELVVTGQKVEGMGLDAAVSGVAFDAETLSNFGIQDVSDIAKITPNLQINAISATSPTFFVRGVGLNDFAANSTGAVAIYQDGVPINAPALQLGQLFDTSSVRVERGPQTWGNERNASAGVIDIRSRLPDGERSSTLQVSLGRYWAREVEGAVAFPLVKSEALSTRISFDYAGREPFVDNGCGGLEVPTQGACGSSSFPSSAEVPAGLPSEVNGKSRWGMRGLFRYQLDEHDMDWLLNVHGSKIDQDSELGQVIGTSTSRAETKAGYIDPAVQTIFDAYFQQFRDEGLNAASARRAASQATLGDVTADIGLAEPFSNDYNLVGQEEMGTYGGSVSGDMGFGAVRFKSITGAEAYDRSRVTDYDFSPDETLEVDASDRAWQLTQSFEATSTLDEWALDWTGGGFFLMESMDAYTDFVFNTAGNPSSPPPLTDQQYSQKSYSFGFYGNADWDFADAFTLSGGVRLNYDRKDFELSVSRGAGLANTVPGEASQTWFAPTGGLSLTWRPTEMTAVYLKYTHGWKPGVFNSAILVSEASGGGELAPDIRETDPESVDSFELGFNGSWLDSTLELRAAAFYYKYHDYQVFLFKSRSGSPPQFEVVNANDAEIYGVEADLFARPLAGRVPEYFEALSLDARFSWLESEFLDFTDTRTIAIPPNVITQVVEYTGNRLPNTPRFKVSGGVWWEFGLFGFGSLTPRYDVSYQADVFFDPSQGVGRPIGANLPLPQYGVGQRAYTLHDVRLTWHSPDDRFEVSGWVHNASNENYKTYVAYADSIQSLLNWVGDPRTFGVSAKVDWSW
jgi:iron complex outermembrane receptor protein